MDKNTGRLFFSLAVFFVLTLLVILSAFLIINLSKSGQKSLNKQDINKSAEIPGLPVSTTPFPFEELTIPYLRQQGFDSEMIETQRLSENVSYTSYVSQYLSQGLKINGLLKIPKGTPPQNGWPAVIFIHGYIPPARYDTVSSYSSYTDYIARNGIAVFKIDLRGHAQSEGVASGAYYSSDYIIDTLNSISALEKYPGIDSASIGLWGHSMAGNIIMRTLAVKPDIKKAVIWAGAVYTYRDFRDYGIADASYQPPSGENERARKRKELFDNYQEFSETSFFWKNVAVTEFLKDLKGSVQIHHAENDNIVSIEYSRNLLRLLRENEIMSSLFEYKNGGHNITGDAFNEAMRESVNFLKNN